MTTKVRTSTCVPGTSVPSERLFSNAGEVVAGERSNIKPKTVDTIHLFLALPTLHDFEIIIEGPTPKSLSWPRTLT